MKACIFIQGQYGKIGHALARVLKSEYGVTEFCTYVYALGTAEFVRSQRDIVYSSILVDHELHAQYKNEVIDTAFIKRFEKTYGPPHLWQHLYADRKLMMSIGPKEETTAIIDPLYNHEDLLRVFQVRAKAIEEMLVREKPDFLVQFAIGAVGHLLVYHVAKKLGIATFTLDFPRIGNRVSVSENYNTLTGVEELFQSIRGQLGASEKQEAKDFLARYRTTGSLNLEYFKIAQELNPAQVGSFLHPKRLIRTLRYLVTLTRNYLQNRKLFVYGETALNPWRFIVYNLRRRYRRVRGLDDLYTQPQDGEEYAYFPLHYEPELAILVLSPFYFDQLQLVRSIARALPLHMKLYVKEHPSMKFRRARSYYKELLKIPNVRLVPHTIPSFDLIQKAQLVTTITGTVGWEACLLKKPVITFGEVFYNALPFVRRARSLDELPALIRDRLENFDYNEEVMEDFLTATLRDSFGFDYAGLWYQNNIDTLTHDEGLRKIAEVVMDKMRKRQK